MLFATQFSDRLRKAKSEEALPALARELVEIIQLQAPTFKPLLLIELGRGGSSDKAVEELDLSLSDMAKRSELKAQLFSMIGDYADQLFKDKAMYDAGLVECENQVALISRFSPTTASGMIAKFNSLALTKKQVKSSECSVRRTLLYINSYARKSLFESYILCSLAKSWKARRIIVGTQLVSKEVRVHQESYWETRASGILSIDHKQVIMTARGQPPVGRSIRNVKTIRVTFSLKEGIAESAEVALLDEKFPEKVESTQTQRIQYIPLKPDEKVAGLEVVSNGDCYVDLADDPENKFFY